MISKVEKRFGMSGRVGRSPLFLLGCWILFIPWSALWCQGPASLRGLVTDPSGAVVPRATVLVNGQPNGPSRTTTTNGQGLYQIGGLPPGRYTVTVKAQGFAPSVKENVVLTAGHTVALDIGLAIASEAQRVEVRAGVSQLQVAPQSNASAVVVTGQNLNALSNDPDQLQNQISALAGPSVGAGAADVYIDGFTKGDMPPKSAIREIRVQHERAESVSGCIRRETSLVPYLALERRPRRPLRKESFFLLRPRAP